MAKSGSALLRKEELWAAKTQAHVMVEEASSCIAGGLPHKKLINKDLSNGNIFEIYGRRSSGRTALCLHVLAQSTAQGEVCAVVDLHNSFHPASAQKTGVALEQVVWVRCGGNVQHAMRATDHILQAGGFGVVLLDLGEASPQALHRIPISYWHRVRRGVEHTPSILLVCADNSEVKCSLVSRLAFKRKVEHWAGEANFLCFRGLETTTTSSKALSGEPEPFYLSSVA